MKMFDEQQYIEISDIFLENQYFRITTAKPIKSLILSINHLGIISPPVVLPENNGFAVVCGFRRIEAAQALNLAKIKAIVLPSHTPQMECIRLCIADNSFQRPLNLIEISRSFTLLQQHVRDNQTILKEAALLGLPSNKDYQKKIVPLCRMPESFQNAILDDVIPFPIAWQLSQMPHNQSLVLVDIFKALNCSLNKQREIIVLAKEIGIREDISIADVLLDDHMQKIILDNNLDKNQKTRQVRTLLRRRRYPRITESERNFFARVEKLELSETFRLVPPPEFEGSTFRLSLDFKDLVEIQAHRKKLDELIHNPEFISILKNYPQNLV